MRVQFTEFAFSALSAFASAVRSAENAPEIRVVIGMSKNPDESAMSIRAGLDRGEQSGVKFQHEQTGLEFVFVHGALADFVDDAVVWLRKLDDLTLEIAPTSEYLAAMGDAQGQLIALSALPQ